MNDNEDKGKDLYYEPVELLKYKEPVPFPGTKNVKKVKKKSELREWVGDILTALVIIVVGGVVLLGLGLIWVMMAPR